MSTEVNTPYRKISSKEYEIQIDGRTKTILCPFAKTQALLKAFSAEGGLVNPATGEVATDLGTLVANFESLGTILLSEYDQEGKLVKEVSCTSLDNEEVISLFVLAKDIIENFTNLIFSKALGAEMSQEDTSKEGKVKKQSR